MKALIHKGKTKAVAKEGHEWQMVNGWHEMNLPYFLANGKIIHYRKESQLLLSLFTIVILSISILCLIY